MSNTLGYIADGMEIEGYIAEVPGLHVALEFRYRPTLPRTRARVCKQIGDAEPERAEELSAAHMARSIVSWNLDCSEELNGQPKIHTQTLLQVQPVLNVKLFGIVIGNRPNDARPERNEPSKRSDSDLNAELDGLQPDPEHVGDHVGNSVKASS